MGIHLPLNLLLLRHEKSSHASHNITDHERPLNEQGNSNAVKISEYMKENRLKPDQILCSTALRARQTLDPIISTWPGLSVSYKNALYLCTTKTAIEQLRMVKKAQCVMLVAHNPTMEDLLHQLVDRTTEHKVPLAKAFAPYATGTLTELTFHKDRWSDLDSSSGQLIQFVPQRTLQE